MSSGLEGKDILPDSRLTTVFTPRGATQGMFGWDVPIYCASCGADGGRVPEENCTFAFWLCNACFAKYGDLTLGLMMPDEVFWAQVREAQQEKYGHIPTPEEVVTALADPESLESTLARSRQAMTPKDGG